MILLSHPGTGTVEFVNVKVVTFVLDVNGSGTNGNVGYVVFVPLKPIRGIGAMKVVVKMTFLYVVPTKTDPR
jgi:hypothetical protein